MSASQEGTNSLGEWERPDLNAEFVGTHYFLVLSVRLTFFKIKKEIKLKARHNGTHLWSQLPGRPKQEDHCLEPSVGNLEPQ